MCSVFLFLILRTTCLRTANPFKNIWNFYPVLIGSTITINSFFILWKGFKNISDDIEEWSIAKVAGISFGIGTLSALLSIPLLKKLKEKVENAYNFEESNTANLNISSDQITYQIHENAEKFDPKSEEGLKYLQIFTSVCDAFAHGANDVANAVGPFAAIYMIYNDETISGKSDMSNDAYWILSLGGLGIVMGLAFYGKNIIDTIGTRLCKITPSRGICIELGAAIVIIIGARYGWPLSTTHCQIGATTSIALLEGSKGINWNILFSTCIGWIMTLIIVGTMSALLTAQGIYAPEKL
jgi:sodium-dependent phosphate transporter